VHGKSGRGGEGFADGGDDAALNGEGPAGDARPGGGAVAAAAELGGDVVDVHVVRFGTQADAGQSRFDFFKDAGDHDRFKGAQVINQPLGVVAVGAGARKIAVLEPKVGDLIVAREMEMIVEMFEEAYAGKGKGLIDR